MENKVLWQLGIYIHKTKHILKYFIILDQGS